MMNEENLVYLDVTHPLEIRGADERQPWSIECDEFDEQLTDLYEMPAGGKAEEAIPKATNEKPSGQRALDAAAKQFIVKLIARGYALVDTARLIERHPRTLRRERKRDPAFDAALQRAQAVASCEPKEVVVQAAKTNWRAAAFLMRHHLALADREAKEKRRRGNGREKTNHGE